MEIVPTPDLETAAVGRMMTPWEIFISGIKYRAIRLRRKLPYLVWYNDELDVTVTFSRERLLPDGSFDDAFRTLFGSRLAEVERRGVRDQAWSVYRSRSCRYR